MRSDPGREVRERAQRAVHEEARTAVAAGEMGLALRRTRKVLDLQLAQRPPQARARLACAKGCSMCCHLRVMATPAEVFGLAAYMRGQLRDDALARFVARTAEVAALVHAVPGDTLLLTNIACPLLVDGACGVYPARPLNCRSYHSLDYQACLASFRNPTDPSLTHPQSALETRTHEGVQQGFIDLLRGAAVDAEQYELVTALDEAFQDPEAESRFGRGERAFRRALRL